MAAFAIPLAIAGLGLASTLRPKSSSSSRKPVPAVTTTQAVKSRPKFDDRQADRGKTPRVIPKGETSANPGGTGVEGIGGPGATKPATAAASTGTPTPPSLSDARANAASEASRMAAKMKRKGQSQRPGMTLTGPVTGASLTPRTLLGYA